ncbi:hypothetical protein GGR96_004004 [Thalassospira tepidiphila]|uniref:Uncharacterized protein n=1 Tax=Thalassospira tepidiphila TaxID=393657 RepID=A0ABX0X5I7_9PROT|nr:hypothetical protein [Thalassospira tepidiphila]OCK10011.1 hypothetical protein KO164_4192 [Thalassospira sp. KO164]PXX27930.1 hypothetical protein C7967_11144 [Thalassospira sp. 11-3]SEE86938.1 hypothetical protein SAMN04515623_4246 [Thalassospira permensis]
MCLSALFWKPCSTFEVVACEFGFIKRTKRPVINFYNIVSMPTNEVNFNYSQILELNINKNL